MTFTATTTTYKYILYFNVPAVASRICCGSRYKYCCYCYCYWYSYWYYKTKRSLSCWRSVACIEYYCYHC